MHLAGKYILMRFKNSRQIYLAIFAMILIGGSSLSLFHHKVIQLDNEAAERLQVGMTLPEVENVLGAPAGDYASHRVSVLDVGASLGWHNNTRFWIGDQCAIGIRFDSDVKVVDWRVCPVYMREESFLERVLRAVHLQ